MTWRGIDALLSLGGGDSFAAPGDICIRSRLRSKAPNGIDGRAGCDSKGREETGAARSLTFFDPLTEVDGSRTTVLDAPVRAIFPPIGLRNAEHTLQPRVSRAKTESGMESSRRVPLRPAPLAPRASRLPANRASHGTGTTGKWKRVASLAGSATLSATLRGRSHQSDTTILSPLWHGIGVARVDGWEGAAVSSNAFWRVSPVVAGRCGKSTPIGCAWSRFTPPPPACRPYSPSFWHVPIPSAPLPLPYKQHRGPATDHYALHKRADTVNGRTRLRVSRTRSHLESPQACARTNRPPAATPMRD